MGALPEVTGQVQTVELKSFEPLDIYRTVASSTRGRDVSEGVLLSVPSVAPDASLDIKGIADALRLANVPVSGVVSDSLIAGVFAMELGLEAVEPQPEFSEDVLPFARWSLQQVQVMARQAESVSMSAQPVAQPAPVQDIPAQPAPVALAVAPVAVAEPSAAAPATAGQVVEHQRVLARRRYRPVPRARFAHPADPVVEPAVAPEKPVVVQSPSVALSPAPVAPQTPPVAPPQSFAAPKPVVVQLAPKPAPVAVTPVPEVPAVAPVVEVAPPKSAEEEPKVAIEPEKAQKLVSDSGQEAMVIVDRWIRSGEQESFKGSVMLNNRVSAGAEVSAAGSIIAMGNAVSGRLHAGRPTDENPKGDPRARVLVRSFDAEMVSIAGQYILPDQIPRAMHGQHLEFWLDADGTVVYRQVIKEAPQQK